MNPLSLIRSRFEPILKQLVDDPAPLLEMIKPAQNPDFGDYQANCAMPLRAKLDKQPREIAADIVSQLDLSDFCEPPEIAGPGFINIRLTSPWLTQQVVHARNDDRLGILPVENPQTYIVDYSSPNVAKPMHVGHIRSTVIGDAICKVLRYLGHKVISDNHIGDWGTQFGMIIYGYKHFVDQEAYAQSRVPELSRLYRLVNQLVEYHNTVAKLPDAETQLTKHQEWLEQKEAEVVEDGKAQKKHKKELKRLQLQVKSLQDEVETLTTRIAAIESSPEMHNLAKAHPGIAQDVLAETAKLHEGDATNMELWNDFLPACRDEMQRVYDRLGITFDYEYGESFYHDQLADVVTQLEAKELAEESDGAMCVFPEGFDTPMIVRKKDGAYLYATTDLATIDYRMQEWQPDAILYVVDHRQGEHFEKLFAVARLVGHTQVDLRHISFGTVLGEDGKPFKTRSGAAAGLEALLDEAVAKAFDVVSENDDNKPGGPELDEDERRTVAHAVGHGAIKYADLSHNRTSDYRFVAEQMVQLEGKTGAYMQYSYARIQSIFAKCDVTPEKDITPTLELTAPMERALAMELLRFDEALADTVVDFRPNQLTEYLFSLAQTFSRFYGACSVMNAETADIRNSRLLLCHLTAQTIQRGLALLGIDVVDRM